MSETPPRFPRIYLGGDLVFRPDASEIFHRLKELCLQERLHGVSPFDGQDEVTLLPPGEETSHLIARLDRDLMDGCDGALFCVDPFRSSPDMDSGTAVEIGYITAQGKPMTGYTADGRSYHDKVAAQNDGPLTQLPPDGAGKVRWRDSHGMLVHSEGLLQNAMVEGFIRQSGGRIFSNGNREAAAAEAVRALAVLFHDRNPVPELTRQALAARERAYAPYSHFLVGAAVQDETGRIFSGGNVENAAYPEGVCAEAGAISAMIRAGGKRITHVMVAGKGPVPCLPCGGCRQKLREFSAPDTPVFVCDEGGALLHQSTTGTLLPHSFGPENLA